MRGRLLNVSEWDAGVEGNGHDEACPEHVGVHRGQAGSLADGSHPSMSGAAVEALAVVAGR